MKDPSYVREDQLLIFRPEPGVTCMRCGGPAGAVIAVEHAMFGDPLARARAPVLVAGYCPRCDVEKFTRLFERHIHPETAPNVMTINDGWGTQKGSGREPGKRPRLLKPGTY
jgi:hypothetical protein